MARKINYDNWSKEELIKELCRIKETKYGLVWHRDLPEEKIDILINPDERTPSEMFPNEMAGKPFPILKEIKNKELNNDKGKPVNLLIEGDNYHALTCLNYTHKEKIDVIYIDPPYNTGKNDFKYNDKFVDKEDSYRHSKWLNFMEKRLRLARNLLNKSGVIFISIDDNEVAQLKLLCDEIFGQDNFVCSFNWQTKKGSQGMITKNMIVSNHEYILVYSKHSGFFSFLGEKRSDEGFSNPDNDSRGLWKRQYLQRLGQNLSTRTIKNPKNGMIFTFETPYTQKKLEQWISEGRIVFPKTNDSYPARKEFLDEYKTLKQLITSLGLYATKSTTEKLYNLFDGQKIFTNPKPDALLEYLFSVTLKKNDIILDFFAGSGTTGHAVLKLNEEDNGNRQFILCTNNENKICEEVCYQRIKKVIKGYKKNGDGEKVEGIKENLKYYKTDFVEAEPTDRNKRKLVNKSTEMLCIRENAFELVSDKIGFKIFKNSDKYLGIVFYEEAIGDFKKAIKKIKGHFNTYVFSLGDDPHEKQFVDVKSKVALCAIPEVILKVYREIFK